MKKRPKQRDHLPWFAFYPADWKRDAQRLRPIAKAHYIDLLCAMWDSPTRGEIRWPIYAYASYLGVTVEVAQETILELLETETCDGAFLGKKQPSGTIEGQVGDSPHSVPDLSPACPPIVLLINRRMVREQQARENKRKHERDKKRQQRQKRDSPGSVPHAVPEKTRDRIQNSEFRRQNLEEEGEIRSHASVDNSVDNLKEEEPPSAAYNLPPFLEKKVWDGFVEMRKKRRFPVTDYAINLIFEKLAQFKTAGYDPNEILNNSTRCGYPDVYEPRQENGLPPEGELSERTKRILRRGL